MDKAEESRIKATETKLTHNVISFWLCLAVIVFCLMVSIWISITNYLHQQANWMPVIDVSLIATFFVYLSALSWQTSKRHRSLLMQLHSDASRKMAEQPEVWPPLSNVPNK